MQETVNMNPEEFRQYIMGIMNKKLEETKLQAFSSNTLKMKENAIKIEVYSFLMQYESFINTAYMQVNNIKREDRDKVTFKAEKPRIEYYNFLNGALNDEMSFFSRFSNFSNFLAFNIDVFKHPNGKGQPAKEQFAYFKEKFAPVVGVDRGILFDVIQAKMYGQQLSEMKFFSDSEKQELRDVFSDKPAFAESLIAENDKMVALIADNMKNKESVAHETPNVSQDKVFDAILAKYKGKVVMVDFWATWCGPCINANKAILPLKEELKGKDVVWLYLTGETSPLATWMKMYPTISGEHYRVSEAQWNYWYKTYGIQGIPTYMVYDRQGKQLLKHVAFPGIETLRQIINKGL
jgi:thiol-disulfide isomerase/thioredoxin